MRKVTITVLTFAELPIGRQKEAIINFIKAELEGEITEYHAYSDLVKEMEGQPQQAIIDAIYKEFSDGIIGEMIEDKHEFTEGGKRFYQDKFGGVKI